MSRFYKKTFILTLLAMICFTVLFFTGCSQSEMAAWVEQNFGFVVEVKIVELDNGTEAYEWVSGEYTADQKSQIKDSVLATYDVTHIRDATVKYNCHSYAWYSTSTSNTYWINDPANFRTNWLKSTTWTDSIPSGIQVGDRVDYYVSANDRPHSAKVYSVVSDLFISKWGALGLYVHAPTEVPTTYDSGQLGYYRP